MQSMISSSSVIYKNATSDWVYIITCRYFTHVQKQSVQPCMSGQLQLTLTESGLGVKRPSKV